MIIKAGPVVKYSGMLPLRMVLREIRQQSDGPVVEYVVHVQCWDDGRSSFAYGSYFPVHCYKDAAEAKAKAEACFVERSKEKYRDAAAEHYQHPDAITVTERLRVA